MTDIKNAIEIKGLSKTYAASRKMPEHLAVDNIDLSIPRGSVFALLGPNGAGKSTTINILAGLVTKTSGDVHIWGRDIDTDERSAKAAIGIVPQEIIYDPFFTPAKALDLHAGLYGVPKAERRTMELLETVGLADKADVYARTLSGGMRRRLMVAKAMVHNPPILVLDEPTAGVDVELRRQLWDSVKELNKQGVTIVLTTHYLEEAEELCDTIAIINHGKIVACEDKETLLSRIEAKEIRFRLDRPFKGALPKDLVKLGAEKVGRRSLQFCYAPGEQMASSFIEAIQKSGYSIQDVSTKDSDLEDVFLQLTRAA